MNLSLTYDNLQRRFDCRIKKLYKLGYYWHYGMKEYRNVNLVMGFNLSEVMYMNNAIWQYRVCGKISR